MRSRLGRPQGLRRRALIGHSQGTYLLRKLVREQIDRRPSVRRRLVSVLLLGGNVVVRKGRDWGGDFRNIRACRAAGQTGCVVAYSAFYGIPPADARFGRVDDRFGAKGDPATQEVLCTNPAALGGGTGQLDPYFATAPFAGPLVVGLGSTVRVAGARMARCGSASRPCQGIQGRS